MLDSTKPLTDSILVRKKYISISKKVKKNLENSLFDTEKPLNDEASSMDINCLSCDSLQSSGFTYFKRDLDGISNTSERLDIFSIANQSTQDSLITSQSIEDYEIKEKVGRVSIEENTTTATLNYTEIKSPSKIPIFDSMNTDEFDHSNDSSPHLYTDYADRLKNILLKYFDES